VIPKASKAELKDEEPGLTVEFEERIRRHAYELYLLRGGEHGHDIDDWLQAEAELMAERFQSAIQANPRSEHQPGSKAQATTLRGKIKRSRSAKQASTEEERGGDEHR
jgi:hypothetical protein